MSETFKLSGDCSSKPQQGNPSGQPNTVIPFSETLGLGYSLVTGFTLDSDAAQVVNLGTLTGVNVLVVKAIGGKVRVRITSTDGTNAEIPCDPILILMSRDVDITAIDVTRTPATQTQVLIYMGQKDA